MSLKQRWINSNDIIAIEAGVNKFCELHNVIATQSHATLLKDGGISYLAVLFYRPEKKG